MAVSELKNLVKSRLDKVNDEYFLEETLNLLNLEAEKGETYIITAEHEKELEISLEQMQNGDLVSNEEVDVKVKRWLSK